MAVREWAMGFIKRHTMFRDPGNPLGADGPAVRLIRLVRTRELARSAHSSKVHPGRLLSRADRIERWGRGDDFRSYYFVSIPVLRGSINVSGGAQRAMQKKKEGDTYGAVLVGVSVPPHGVSPSQPAESLTRCETSASKNVGACASGRNRRRTQAHRRVRLSKGRHRG